MKLFIVAGTQELCFRIVNYTSWYRIQTISLPMVRGIDSETKTPRSSIVERRQIGWNSILNRVLMENRVYSEPLWKWFHLLQEWRWFFFFWLEKGENEEENQSEKRNIYELKEKKSVWNRIRICGHPKNFWMKECI